MSEKKKICGECASYDLFCGICLNVKSPIFWDDIENDSIYEREACEKYVEDKEI